MNSQKLIHLFLITVLCFGQFAASTHIAGHAHHLHGTGDLHVVGDSSAQATLIRVLELRKSFARVTENSDSEEGVDCSIYHAFSSLCGAISSAGSVAADWSRLSATLPANERHIAHASSNDQRIRAPPRLS